MNTAKSFKEIYEALPSQRCSPRGAFVRRIAAATKKSVPTVRNWLCGQGTPDALTQAAIARELKVDVTGLFPAEQQQ